MLLRVAYPGSGRVISPEPDGGGDQEKIRDHLTRREARALEVPEHSVSSEIRVWEEDTTKQPPALSYHLI